MYIEIKTIRVKFKNDNHERLRIFCDINRTTVTALLSKIINDYIETINLEAIEDERY